MLRIKTLLASIILTFGLFAGGIQLENSELAYGQFFETNSTFNSTGSDNPGAAEIVLLSQKLKKSEFGNRHLIGEVKNIGNDTASSNTVHLTTYDKNEDILGTTSSYVEGDSLGPNQKSTFDLVTSADDFKGMDHYELSLRWDNSDGTEGYVENAKIYMSNSTGSND